MRRHRSPAWPILTAMLLIATACGGASQPAATPQVVLTIPPAGATTSATALASATPPASSATSTSVATATATAVPASATPITTAPQTPGTSPADTPSQPAEITAQIVNVETIDERTSDLTIETSTLATPVKVRLLLPAGFDAEPARRWPVLYLLHGAGMDPLDAYSSWAVNTDVQALVAPTNLLVVMPQGDTYGWYSDWWNGGKGGPPMWETFHLTELAALLERDWRAGDQRVIAGLSMGGYGAMVYAAHRPGMFKAAASFSGPLDILGEKDFIGPDPGTWGDPVEQVDIWKAHNPIDLAEALRGTDLYVSYGDGGQGPLDTEPVRGDDAEGFRAIGNRAFVERLATLAIPVTVDAYGPGSHSWPYFERALHRSLPMLLKVVGEGS